MVHYQQSDGGPSIRHITGTGEFYQLYSDESLAGILEFPKAEWCLYDVYRREFTTIPVHAAFRFDDFEGVIIIRPLHFNNSDCLGLSNLLFKHYGHVQDKGKGKADAVKRKASSEGMGSESKRACCSYDEDYFSSISTNVG